MPTIDRMSTGHDLRTGSSESASLCSRSRRVNREELESPSPDTFWMRDHLHLSRHMIPRNPSMPCLQEQHIPYTYEIISTAHTDISRSTAFLYDPDFETQRSAVHRPLYSNSPHRGCPSKTTAFITKAYYILAWIVEFSNGSAHVGG